jgi:hypothetical protein
MSMRTEFLSEFSKPALYSGDNWFELNVGQRLPHLSLFLFFLIHSSQGAVLCFQIGYGHFLPVSTDMSPLL